MARKHVEEYYNKMYSDYHEMLECLRDMEKECENGLVSPDRVEAIQKSIEPIKSNFMTISWIMFLLNKPQRKRKQARYEKSLSKNTSKLDSTKSLDGLLENNKVVLKELKDAKLNIEE